MKTSDLMWILDNVLPARRNPSDFDDLTVYHITATENVDSIKSVGIQARSSSQSYDRPDAVYFFVDRDEVNASNAAILGVKNVNVITVKIPAEKVAKYMRWDGLYNVGFDTYSAVQYMDNVPAEWIINIE